MSARAIERFTALMQQPEADIELDVACLLAASCVRDDSEPDEVVAWGVGELDRLAARGTGPSGRAGLDDLRADLFGSGGFSGNRNAYDDPRNSYLDEVLRRRTGIPITLAIVAIEVGRRRGVPLSGIGMPGHFLLGAGDGRYLDAFDGGQELDASGCRRRFAELAGPEAPWSEGLLAPVGPHAILARVLANLRAIFAGVEDLSRLARVLELRNTIPGVPPVERAERSAVLAALGRYDEAADELDLLAAVEHDNSDDLHGAAAALRARLN